MSAFHIHIEGIVQGVGFRPFIYKLALENKIKGWVINTTDGVHIHVDTDRKTAENFLQSILNKLPPLSIVTNHSIEKTNAQHCLDFTINHSVSKAKPKLLLTPDVAICNDCKKELEDQNNRRFQYPFSTCTNCGPRYSIINNLPYDRVNTTMKEFNMCNDCLEEYNDPLKRRHYSQTNSCPECPVELQLYTEGKLIEKFEDLDYIVDKWKEGKIIALKGIGGFILTCDATNAKSIATLRERKKRPSKPFAVMYPNCQMISRDLVLHDDEKRALQSVVAPIVLVSNKNTSDKKNQLAINEINHGLSRVGVMLPYTPLYEILLKKLKKPIIATSGNITDSTIVFEDQKAMSELAQIADIILLNNREIIIPQDDGVEQYSTQHRQKIILRRSRGKAPAYINSKLKIPDKTVLATGAMLKSAFGLFNMGNTYISQYLGNTESYDAQLNYEKTFQHFQNLFSTEISTVITDMHPNYFSTHFGQKIAAKTSATIYALQHHKAHFYSILGEHDLFKSQHDILGVIWDGTGLGDDGNIWGGEFFMFQQGQIERVFNLSEFDFILGDKMPREPRISALAIGHTLKDAEKFIKPKFTKTEWNIYKKLLNKKDNLKCTSMGRFFDAMASILFDYDTHSFEAEASMQLEKQASKYYYAHKMSLNDSYLMGEEIPANFVTYILEKIIFDLNEKIDKPRIAAKFHITLVHYIMAVADKFSVQRLAFSGGVFQNALLVDMIIEFMNEKNTLYWHKEFSPNDEGIAFGQLMYFLQNKVTL